MAHQRLSRLQRRILDWLAAEERRTQGVLAASHSNLVRAVGVEKKHLSASLRSLMVKGLIRIHRTSGGEAVAVTLTAEGRSRVTRPTGSVEQAGLRPLTKGRAKMTLRERYTRLSLWNKLAVWGALVSFVGLLLAVVPFILPGPPPEEPAPVGFLSPGNAPTPVNPCDPLEPGEFVLLAGSVGYPVSRDNHHVAIVQLNGQPTVWIDYKDQGVYVSADLAREDGRAVATLRDNKFEINTNNYYELQRPSRHELIVKDKLGTVVLRAAFLNERAFRIEGHFIRPGYGNLTITRDGITIQNPRLKGPYPIQNVCFRDAPQPIKA